MYCKYKKFDSLIVDHYNLDHKWENKMRKFAEIIIDDLANRKHDCDVLIDQNLYVDNESRYEELVSKKTIKLLSPKYAIIKEDFVDISQKKNYSIQLKIYLFVWATDRGNHTHATLQTLKKINYKFNSINIFTTIGNKNCSSIEKESKKINNCNFYKNNKDLAKLPQ